MLLLALGGEASKAHTDLLELGRPPGKPRLAGKQIAQAESKCHSNICRAVCNCCTEVSNMKVKDGKAAWGAEGRAGMMQTFCRGFSFLCVGRICLLLLLACVLSPPTTVDIDRQSFKKTKASLCFQ